MRLIYFAALAVLLFGGCSKIIINKVAGGGGGASFIMNDDDPEFVADALPLALKAYEGLIEKYPKHAGLKLTAATGFTSYSYAFIHFNADMENDADKRKQLYIRARNMYVRARDYGLAGLELKYPNFRKNLARNPDSALVKTKIDDCDLLYWTGMAWMGAFTCDKFNMKLALTVPQAKALLFRVAQLNPDYGNGTIDEFLITFYGSMPASMGGDVAKAKEHFERALKLSEGKSYSAYINYVQAVSVAQQNEKEFDELLQAASQIKVDDVPAMKLLRILQLEKVRYLIENKDLFIIPEVSQTENEF